MPTLDIAIKNLLHGAVTDTDADISYEAETRIHDTPESGP